MEIVMAKKISKKQQKKIKEVIGEYKEGKLKSGGSGKKVTSIDQALAIAYSSAGIAKKKEKRKYGRKEKNNTDR